MNTDFEQIVSNELANRSKAYQKIGLAVDWQSAISAIAEKHGLVPIQTHRFMNECAVVIAFALERDEPLSRKLSDGSRIKFDDARRLAHDFDDQIVHGVLSAFRSIGINLAGESLPPERQAMFLGEDGRLKVTSTTFEYGQLYRHIGMVSRVEYSMEPAKMWGLIPKRHYLYVDVESDRIGRHDDFWFRFKDAGTAHVLKDALNTALEIDQFRQKCTRAKIISKPKVNNSF